MNSKTQKLIIFGTLWIFVISLFFFLLLAHMGGPGGKRTFLQELLESLPFFSLTILVVIGSLISKRWKLTGGILLILPILIQIALLHIYNEGGLIIVFLLLPGLIPLVIAGILLIRSYFENQKSQNS